MEHIATLYTHAEGRQRPNLIHYFWDQSRITLLQQKEYLIQGIRCPEEAEEWDPNIDIWNWQEALMMVAGTTEPGPHYWSDGTVMFVY